jgi:RNA polymerase sigma-70 factor (ECF subfamily)
LACTAYTRLPHETNTRAWLFKIATNLCRNHFRYRQRHPAMQLPEALAAVERAGRNGAVAAPEDPALLALSRDMEQRVLGMIAALPLKQKAALIQRKLHGLPYDSIASSLQCSPDAARAHVFQALKKLRTALDAACAPRQVSKPRRTRETL